ncbi:helix-turn-helix domain-containing protein [Streptomyces sp. SAS_272]|uniref:helix-turn-helix domain-containing protein n=1 Tax=Streptomyces sp. SAS_272 TaxID=3412747 RepID=UPI00403C91DB
MHHYLTTAEVAAHYRTVPGTVRYWRHVGYGPKCAKVGRRYLYPATAVQAFDQELLAKSNSKSEGAEEQLPGHLDANAERVTSHQR